MKTYNPFITSGYAGPKTFCDRERETSELLLGLENGRNVTLIAPRRYGKTGLIRNVMNALPKEFDKVYVDIYATERLSDFVKTFADAVVSSLATPGGKFAATLGRFFGSLRPTMSPQPDGSVKWSFDLAETAVHSSLEGTFDFLASRRRPVVIAIDEFQQIRKYPEDNVEALLRARIQFLPNIRFVFAGSQLRLMSGMFVAPRGAFYNSTDILSLDVIGEEPYRQFAERFFKAEGLPFSGEAFAGLYRRFEGITWYVQSVLNRIWQKGAGFRNDEDVEEAIGSLVDNRDLVFHDLLRSQGVAARSVLRAVAADGIATAPTGRSFLLRHRLGAPSTIAGVLDNLVDRELLYRTERGYVVYDRLFAIWLRRLAK